MRRLDVSQQREYERMSAVLRHRDRPNTTQKHLYPHRQTHKLFGETSKCNYACMTQPHKMNCVEADWQIIVWPLQIRQQ